LLAKLLIFLDISIKMIYMAIDERWYAIGNGSRLINLEGIEFREYQFNIIRSILENGNTLVVLPTGLGKTFIATALMADSIARGKKALLLAPTKPLAEQHHKTMMSALNIGEENMLLLIGSINKKERVERENKANVIIATPQTITNDIKNGLTSMRDFGVVIFDECHRAVGKYAYTYLANECVALGICIVGLTASPGGKMDKIKKLVGTLNIRQIEARGSSSADVAKYVKGRDIYTINVELTDRIREISRALRPIIEDSLSALNRIGVFHFKHFDTIPKGRLIQLGDHIQKIKTERYRFAAAFNYVRLLNMTHAYDLLNTEGIYPFLNYIDGLYKRENKSKALENLLKNQNLVAAKKMAEDALKNGEEHPKVMAVLDIIRRYNDCGIIVFAQYRSTIKMLVEYLNNNDFPAMPFVGKKDGVTQEKQKETIERFREKKFRVLVASSIGEEGLDIPNVDLVIFYEPIPNEIRNIQRRGRTGRFRTGDVYILVANNTKDQIYLYISRQREVKMLSIIDTINNSLRKERVIAGDKQRRL
jgi:Fanconi anemia group M protein